jgi:putative flavoprotein involved in K+ transport
MSQVPSFSEHAGSGVDVERVETVIIGGGQAGLAMSYHLSQLGLEHLVLERARVADRWRTQRWDSLMFQFPNWSIALPGHAYSGNDPDGFSHKDAIVRFIEDYAVRARAPIRTGTNVIGLRRAARKDRYVVTSERGDLEAHNVVIATGPYQRPLVPQLSAGLPRGLLQLHASEYRNPAALPAGSVLVVGSGASGCQIADELLEAGRRVYLSVGRHHRFPRRYRGRDVFWWLLNLGRLDAPAEDSPEVLRAIPPLFTGVHGGYDLDLRRSAARGMTLLGHLAEAHGGRFAIKPDLEESLIQGDKAFEEFTCAADEYVKRAHTDAPVPRGVDAPAPVISHLDAIHEIDIRVAGIRSVIWATGYSLDFGWVELPVLDARGEPVQQRGVTAERGIYFLGLKWQHKRKSSFLFGVGEDAAYVAERISENRN